MNDYTILAPSIFCFYACSHKGGIINKGIFKKRRLMLIFSELCLISQSHDIGHVISY